jgi:hypothetical protein
LLHQVPNGPDRVEAFLRKLGSLAQLALSAGVQKRAFLRRIGRAWPTFLLERARLLVVPIGLDQAASQLAGNALAGSAVARQISQRLGDVLHQEGRTCHLEACIDASPATEGTGISFGDTASIKQQIKAAGPGTVSVVVTDEEMPANETLAELLHWTWKQTEIGRLRFLRAGEVQQQLIAPWELQREEG